MKEITKKEKMLNILHQSPVWDKPIWYKIDTRKPKKIKNTGQLILEHLETPKTNKQLAKLIFKNTKPNSTSKISMAMKRLINKQLVERTDVVFTKTKYITGFDRVERVIIK